MAHMAGGRGALHGSRALTGEEALPRGAVSSPTTGFQVPSLGIYSCTPLALHPAPDCTRRHFSIRPFQLTPVRAASSTCRLIEMGTSGARWAACCARPAPPMPSCSRCWDSSIRPQSCMLCSFHVSMH